MLIMPGIGYTVDRPLLYWAARALSWDGWSVDRLWLDLPDVVDFPRTIDRMNGLVDSWVSGITSSGHDDDSVMVVTKSLSTLTYPHLVDRGLPAVLLTPVLNPPPCDPAESVITVPDSGISSSDAAPLLCAGDADPYFDGARAASLTGQGLVRVYPKANHSIEVSGDWSTSIRYLRDVTESIVRYGSVVRGVRRGHSEDGESLVHTANDAGTRDARNGGIRDEHE